MLKNFNELRSENENKAVFLLLLFLVSVGNYIYNEKVKEEIYHIKLRQRAEIILNVMDYYKEKHGDYPKDLNCCFKLKVSKTKKWMSFYLITMIS